MKTEHSESAHQAFVHHVSVRQEAAANSVNGQYILVIDDDAEVREILCRLLKACGYRTLAAVNGTKGLAFYRENRGSIGLVLADMNLHAVEDAALIREIRNINPDARIIAMSGTLRENDLIDAELDHLPFLAKPSTLREILSAVQRVQVGPSSAAA